MSRWCSLLGSRWASGNKQVRVVAMLCLWYGSIDAVSYMRRSIKEEEEIRRGDRRGRKIGVGDTFAARRLSLV